MHILTFTEVVVPTRRAVWKRTTSLGSGQLEAREGSFVNALLCHDLVFSTLSGHVAEEDLNLAGRGVAFHS